MGKEVESVEKSIKIQVLGRPSFIMNFVLVCFLGERLRVGLSKSTAIRQTYFARDYA